ncbi:hypothetical protein PVK06_023535 [Gossypium arboreum]|uniref:Uncharacterized protein n=1 Tax=Gossypium arboreum TaxID=29729 RepID=A0ABR0PBQ8_GOSAR|nr:hypothetical protein PVK06_023535 [Gossypium arboreum]
MFFPQTPPRYGSPPHVVGSSFPAGTYFRPLTSFVYYTPMPMSMLNPMSGQMLTYSLPTMMIPMQTPMEQPMLGSMSTYLRFGAPYGYTPIVTQTPHASLFFTG